MWDHKRGLLVAQHAIRGYMIGKQWLWWNLWLALKPNLKSGHFEEFKEELARKIKYAQDHLEEVIQERAAAEKKHASLSSEMDEIKQSLAGGKVQPTIPSCFLSFCIPLFQAVMQRMIS